MSCSLRTLYCVNQYCVHMLLICQFFRYSSNERKMCDLASPSEDWALKKDSKSLKQFFEVYS